MCEFTWQYSSALNQKDELQGETQISAPEISTLVVIVERSTHSKHLATDGENRVNDSKLSLNSYYYLKRLLPPAEHVLTCLSILATLNLGPGRWQRGFLCFLQLVPRDTNLPREEERVRHSPPCLVVKWDILTAGSSSPSTEYWYSLVGRESLLLASTKNPPRSPSSNFPSSFWRVPWSETTCWNLPPGQGRSEEILEIYQLTW